jgi:hypothetical protein
MPVLESSPLEEFEPEPDEFELESSELLVDVAFAGVAADE